MILDRDKQAKILLFVFLGLFIGVALTPGLTLFSGQTIKQFETYSLAQSMANVGWNPFETTIPCDGGIRWALEIPFYAGLGGFFYWLAPSWPSILPLLVFGLFLLALLKFRETIAPKSSTLPWIAVATTPVFLRFSTQFLADPLALALLLFGCSAYFKKRTRVSFFLFLLAVTAKPTALVSILFFRWAFNKSREPSQLLPSPFNRWFMREVGLILLWVAPFLVWSASLRSLSIPSPLHEGGLLSLGKDLPILFSRNYYSKFFVWTVFKGVGIPLFCVAVFSAVRAQKKIDINLSSELILRLSAWSLGIIPYWLLIRQLNAVHDYYSLSFYAPIAILGAVGADTFLRSNSRKKVITGALLAISIAQGLALFIASALSFPHHSAVENRPVFCGPEMRSESMMHIPRYTPGK